MSELYDLVADLTAAMITVGLFSFSPIWAHHLVYFGIWPTLERPVRTSQRRFALSNLTCLLLYMSVLNGLIRLANRGAVNFGDVWGLCLIVSGNLFAILAWLVALQFLTGRGIELHRSKNLFLLILYPAAIVICVHALMIFGLAIFSIFGFPNYQFRWSGLPSDLHIWIVWMGIGYLVVAIWLARTAFANFLFDSWLPNNNQDVEDIDQDFA